MKTSEFLRLAKDKIDTPEKWIKGDAARNARGDLSTTHSDDACKFCSMGALWRTKALLGLLPLDYIHHNVHVFLLRVLEQAGLGPSVVNFNDHDDTTHEDVMRMYDEAIALAEKEEV